MLLRNLFGCLLLALTLNATAAEFEVGQKDK